MLIAVAHERGDKWAVIENVANQLRGRLGLEPLTLPRMKKLYAANKSRVRRTLQLVRENRCPDVRIVRDVAMMERFIAAPEKVRIRVHSNPGS
jgi:hypothetical protein